MQLRFEPIQLGSNSYYIAFLPTEYFLVIFIWIHHVLYHLLIQFQYWCMPILPGLFGRNNNQA